MDSQPPEEEEKKPKGFGFITSQLKQGIGLKSSTNEVKKRVEPLTSQNYAQEAQKPENPSSNEAGHKE